MSTRKKRVQYTEAQKYSWWLKQTLESDTRLLLATHHMAKMEGDSSCCYSLTSIQRYGHNLHKICIYAEGLCFWRWHHHHVSTDIGLISMTLVSDMFPSGWIGITFTAFFLMFWWVWTELRKKIKSFEYAEPFSWSNAQRNLKLTLSHFEKIRN